MYPDLPIPSLGIKSGKDLSLHLVKQVIDPREGKRIFVSHGIKMSVIDAEADCSVFLTKTTGLAQGLADYWMTSSQSISFTNFVISPQTANGTRRGT